MDGIIRTARCICGRVRCEGLGPPIVSAVCYCRDCQNGGHKLEALPNAPPVLDPDDGTADLTYRDDRFSCVEGAELLIGHELRENAPTQRFVASCCNSGMFLKYRLGHWTSAYSARFGRSLPPIEMRNKTEARKSELPIPQDVPSYRNFPIKLFWRLLMARLAMLSGG